MRADTYLATIDDLKAWWDQAGEGKRPYFTLHRGFEAKPDRILCRNTEISDSDKAFEVLEDMINAHTEHGGTFRVYITDKPNFNVGFTTLLRIKDPNPAAVASIGSAQNFYGIHGDIKTYLQEEVDKRMALYELQRQVEDLRAENESRIGYVDKFMENVINRPELYQLIQGLALKFLGPAPAQHMPPPASTQPQVGQYENEGYDYDRVETSLDTIREVFPDTETALEKIAVWAKQNPDMAKSLLNTL